MRYLALIIDKIEGNKKYHFCFFFVVLVFLSLFMVYSYKLYPSHDFYFHFKRLNVLMDALRDGSFPVYMDHTGADGYGYITKWFYPDVILIPFALIALLTNAVFAYQFMWFSMTVLCGLFMYYAVNRIYNNPYAASISSLLFTFAVYRLLDMYTRSAVGEALSFTFVPIVFLGLYEIINGNYKKWYILTIGYSLLIFTHVLSTFLMSIAVLFLLLIYYKAFVKEPKRICYLLISGLATLLITAYFLYPMLEQMLSNSFYYQTVIKAHPQDHKQPLYRIIWGMFTGIVHPKQLFIPGLGLLLTWAVSLRLFVYEKKSAALRSVDIGVGIGFVFIVLLSFVVPWNVFPFNKMLFIQLPWRLYEFISFFFALAGGYYLSCILKTNRRRFAGSCMVILCTIFILSSSGRDFRFEAELENRPIYEIPTRTTNNYHLYGMEYIPSRVPSIDYVSERGDRIDCKFEGTNISDFKKGKGVTSLNVSILDGDKELIELPLFYYKGYAATLNGNVLPIQQSNNGLIELPVTRAGHIEVWYEGTTVQKVSPFITLLAILLLCGYIILINREK